MENRVKLGEIKFNPAIATIDIDGISVDVQKRISYGEIAEFAKEYASSIIVIDTKHEIAYKSFEKDAVVVYLLCKYFTNIDTDEYEYDNGKLYDMVFDYMDTIIFHCKKCFNIALDIGERYLENTIEIYNARNSLAQKIKTGFGGILNGEDIVKTLTEAREMEEDMIALFQDAKAVTEKENIATFPWAAKKKN